MEVNTYYKDNLKSVMQVNKKYTDDKIEQALELLEDYDLSSETVSQTSQTATAPSDVRTSSLIEIGGNCVKLAPSTASDSTVAKDKSIPNNTFKLNINQIGCMSYKSENLLVLSDVAETTVGGITYKVENGVITFITGTAGSGGMSITFDLINPLPSGTYYYKNFGSGTRNIGIRLSDNSTVWGSNSGASYNIASSIIRIYFYFGQGDSVSNEVYKPMLITGTTAPTVWKRGFTGIRDTATTSVVFSGNLINIQDVAETTVNGITYKAENGNIYLSGTASAGFSFARAIDTINVGTYSSLIEVEGTTTNADNFYLSYESGGYTTFNLGLADGTTKTGSISVPVSWIRTWISAGSTFNNFIIKPMLIKGSTVPTEYKPYVTPLTKQIPSQIQALTGYGWGINNTCYNYIDFDNKKFVQKVGRVDLGTLDWDYNSTRQLFTCEEGFNYKLINSVSSICALYDFKGYATDGNDAQTKLNTNMSYCFYVNEGNPIHYIYFRNDNYTDVTAFKTAMDGVYLYYELATPVETDISSYLTDFNPVDLSNNYTDVEFVNTHNQDMPNTISFFGTIKETLVTSFTIGNVTTNITDTIESDGWSASNTVFNTRKIRDRERHKVVGKVKAKDLTYTYYSTAEGNLFRAIISDMKYDNTTNLLCNLYATVLSSNRTNGTISKSQTGTATIDIIDNNYTDVTTFKNHFTDDDYIYFELATPEVTPLDVDTDFHYIDLASGGTITFNNANNQPCHNTIRYSIMEEKV